MHRVLPPVSIMPTPYGLLASADIAAHQLHGTAARPAQRRRATNSPYQHGWDSAPPRARLAAPLLPSVRGGCRTMLCEDAHDRSSHSGPMPIDLQPTHTARVVGAVNNQLAQPNPFACDVFSLESSVPVSRPTGVLSQRCSESRKQAPSVNQSPARGGTRCTAAYSVHGPPCNTSRTVRLVTAPQTTREPGGSPTELKDGCGPRAGSVRARAEGTDFA